MTLVPNQPYPNLPAWEDLTPELMNGWSTEGRLQYFQALSDRNSAEFAGRLLIGTTKVICRLPEHLRASAPRFIQGLIIGGPICLIELQGSGGSFYQLSLYADSLGMTDTEMMNTYSGQYLSLSGKYTRKSV